MPKDQEGPYPDLVPAVAQRDKAGDPSRAFKVRKDGAKQNGWGHNCRRKRHQAPDAKVGSESGHYPSGDNRKSKYKGSTLGSSSPSYGCLLHLSSFSHQHPHSHQLLVCPASGALCVILRFQTGWHMPSTQDGKICSALHCN